MKTNQSLENLNQSIDTGLKGIFKVVPNRDFFCSWIVLTSFVLSTILVVFVNLIEYDLKEFIKLIIDLILKFLPSILGFTVSGYAIIIGFSQNTLLNKVTEKLSDTKYSLYQKLSGKFAANIISQGVTLIFTFFLSLIVTFDGKRPNLLALPPNIITILNETGAFLISFGFIISLLIVIQIVANVFSFSQLIHYLININKINEDSKKNTT